MRDQIRPVAGTKVYDWYAKVNICKDRIRRFATARYQSTFCAKAKDRIRKLSAEQAQRYLNDLIENDPLLGISILKN